MKKHMLVQPTTSGSSVRTIHTWQPPYTPHMLLQEKYWPNRWKVACVCIFLNCTKRASVETIIDKFFEYYYSPEQFIASYENEKRREEIIEMIKPCGFKSRRAKQIYEFSVDYLTIERDKYITHCKGIGEYADACDRIYFFKQISDVPPSDSALVKVWNWLNEHGADNGQNKDW